MSYWLCQPTYIISCTWIRDCHCRARQHGPFLPNFCCHCHHQSSSAHFEVAFAFNEYWGSYTLDGYNVNLECLVPWQSLLWDPTYFFLFRLLRTTNSGTSFPSCDITYSLHFSLSQLPGLISMAEVVEVWRLVEVVICLQVFYFLFQVIFSSI